MIQFRVIGTPKPGGSKRAMRHPRTGRIVVVEQSDNRDWKCAVRDAARQAYHGEPFDCPLEVEVTFFFTRPASHYNRARQLRSSAPAVPFKRPDLTKLWRSTEDALTDAGIWTDDARVVHQSVRKWYGEHAGARIRIQEFIPIRPPSGEWKEIE